MSKSKIYSTCSVFLILDQFIKLLVIFNLDLYQEIIVIPSFFKIYYLRNEGAAFSSFSGMRYLLIGIGILMVYLINRYISKIKLKRKIELFSLGIVLGGIIGNLIDRLLYGYVIDYLSFTIFNYDFAVFNLADIGIVVGIFLLLIDTIRRDFYDIKSRRRKCKNW